MKGFEDLRRFLKTPKNIVIIPHINPDADALGSCMAIAIYLKKLSHKTTVISPSKYPRFLFWMPRQEEVIIFDERNLEILEKLIISADMIFFMDFSSLSRIGKLKELVVKASATKVLIDHHLDKQDIADFELWNTKAAATAELVYDFIQMMGNKDLLDTDIASCIYAGIMTDTGAFKFPNTSSKVHRIIADLIDTGLDSVRIHRFIYDTNTQDRIKLLGHVLSEKLCFLSDYHTAYITITKEEYRRFKIQQGDTEGLVNYGLTVEGIKLSSIFIQKGDHVKASFRSIGNFSAAKIASKYFNGGGHKNAAGGILLKTNITKALKLFLEVLPEYKNNIKNIQ